MSHEPFTLGLYADYLNIARESGYRFVGFDELTSDPPIIVLRHDVDYSPPRAVEMARLEQGLGVRATYCIHSSCSWYAVAREPHRRAVEAILEAGHELGLHFDASDIADDDEVVYRVEREAATLNRLFRTSITAVSFHMPGRRPVGAIELPPGLVNTYGPQFFDQIAYASDSNQDWRGTDLAELLSRRSVERLQLLIHPFWWRATYGTIGAKLDELAAELGVRLEDIATWEQQELIRAGR